MVTSDEYGNSQAIRDKIAQSIEAAATGPEDRDADIETLMVKLRAIRDRLAPRMAGLPDDETLRRHLETLRTETLRTLVASGEWDTLIVGGEEVDIDIFYRPEEQADARPARVPALAAAA
jgi:hypothetical protein